MSDSSKNNILLNLAHILIGVGFFYLHIWHTRTVFENETKYSHLTNMEREALFSAEHAMYYSYYKTIVDAPNFVAGLNKLIYNNLTEYPSTINTMKYFHIFPEIALGFIYKEFISITQYFNIETNVCWPRSENIDSTLIIDCNGFIDPMNFYLECVWIIGGTIVILLYFYAITLSNNVLGGIAAVTYFFSIHNDATRLHKIPAARENFALPFIVWQMLHLTTCIKRQNTIFVNNNNSSNSFSLNLNCSSALMVLKLIVLSLLANLSWQFASFIFVTQTIIMFILLRLNIITAALFFEFGVSHYICNQIAAYIMFDNRHFAFCLQHPMFILILIYNGKFNQNNTTKCTSIFRWFYDNMLFFIAFLCLVGDAIDVNFLYWDILMTKLRLWSMSFDTFLYFCDDELSFIDWHTVQTYNALFFSKIFAIFIVIHLSKWLQYRRRKTVITDDVIERSKNYLIEDFLEENKITLKDLVNPITDKQLQLCLDQLKECKYDYELYQKTKQKNVKNKNDERMAFLNDVKRFKDEIKGESNIKPMPKNDPDKKKATDELDSTSTHTEMKAEEELKTETEEPLTKKTFVKAYYLYNIMQTIVFLIMTCFVIKLKYILSPFLCLMASTYPPKSWFNKAYHLYWIIYVVSIIFSVADPGIQNFQKQHHPKKYDDNEEFSSLINWIKKNTDESAVFASPSNIITTVMLSTSRPIVNHPRNEFRNMRTRNRLVYSILSKQNHNDVYSQLTKLKVEYVILTHKDCFSYEKHCKISDIWDYVEPENKNNIQVCAELFQKNISNFVKVFVSKNYLVLKLFSHSVQLEFKKVDLKEISI